MAKRLTGLNWRGACTSNGGLVVKSPMNLYMQERCYLLCEFLKMCFLYLQG